MTDGRLGLVLSGGGARGAFEAGVVAAMDDAGLTPVVVSGTSAGAVNAAGLASGFTPAQLGDLWAGLSDTDVYRQRWDVWNLLRPAGFLGPGSISDRILRSIGWTWLWDWRPLRATLVDVLGGEKVPVTGSPALVVSAVEVTSGDLIRYASAEPPRQHRDARVVDVDVDHLIASAAIPLLFRPGNVDGQLQWDGGVVANTPLAPALWWEVEAIVVVTTASLERPAPEPRSVAEVVSLLVDTVQAFTLQADLMLVEEINRRLRAEPPREPPDKRIVEVLLIDPRGEDLGDGLLFDPEQARRLFALGRRIGADALADWSWPTGR